LRLLIGANAMFMAIDAISRASINIFAVMSIIGNTSITKINTTAEKTKQ